MNTFKTLFILIIITSCNTKKKDSLIKIDSSINQINKLNPIDKKVLESFNYIGFVNNFYFSKKPEVYVELYFNKNTNDYNKISKLATEIIHQDTENTRYKLPEKIAKKNFDLSGLEKIHFFDNKNNLIGQSLNFKNCEFLEQNISSIFIASYDTEITHKNIAYCIGGKKPNFSDIKIKETVDTSIQFKIEEHFKINNYKFSEYTLKHKQFKIDSLTLTFSNTDNYSFIHLTKENGQSTMIYDDKEFSKILDIQIIPLLKNKMPVILCKFRQPDSDIEWDNLLVFSNGKYKKVNKQRIKEQQQ